MSDHRIIWTAAPIGNKYHVEGQCDKPGCMETHIFGGRKANNYPNRVYATRSEAFEAAWRANLGLMQMEDVRNEIYG